jgi:hypothetical protein
MVGIWDEVSDSRNLIGPVIPEIRASSLEGVVELEPGQFHSNFLKCIVAVSTHTCPGDGSCSDKTKCASTPTPLCLKQSSLLSSVSECMLPVSLIPPYAFVSCETELGLRRGRLLHPPDTPSRSPQEHVEHPSPRSYTVKAIKVFPEPPLPRMSCYCFP